MPGSLISARQYVLDSDWGEVQPSAADENAFLESHSWEEYGEWHLGLTEPEPRMRPRPGTGLCAGTSARSTGRA